mgnify:CR=1 FL=1
MGAPVKKQFDYYVTNLDWGDGTDLEFVSKPKLFDRSFNFEHKYTMPGFYTIKGLVFKHSLMLKNAWPPKEEDHTKEWTESTFTITDENDEGYIPDGIGTFLKTKQQEDRYIRLAGYNIADDLIGESGTDDSGLQYKPSSNQAFQINKIFNSATVVKIVNDVQSEFNGNISVRVPSTGGTSDGPFIKQDGQVSDGWIGTRTVNGGVRMVVNIHMDPDYNSFFQYKFDAWLPNFGRYSETEGEETPRDIVNNPTEYLVEVRGNPPQYDGDGNEIFNSVDYDSRTQDFQTIYGTNGWQTIQGNFFSDDMKYTRLYVEIRQSDRTKDFDPGESSTSQLDVNGNTVNLTEQFGNRWWLFYLKNIEMRFQNNNDLKFPLEWERFQSNMIINPPSNYVSSFFEKNNFLMIGGLSKNSYHFKTLASIAGYDFRSLDKKENFNYNKYNPYDVINMLDTLAKYDETLYDNYLDPYTEEIYNDDELIHKGMVDKKWHGTFQNTFLTETDIATTKIYKGVKPMWQQLGFDNDNFDNPDKIIYWKNILPKDLDLSNRVGVTQRDLPDPKKGSLTPRIARKEFIVDEEATHYWNDGSYWPVLPKFTKEGAFSDEYPVGTFNVSASIVIPKTYGDEDARITSKVDSDTNIIFDLSFDGDEIVDQTDNSLDTTLNTDFSLKINDDDRVVKNVIDFVDIIEKINKEQAF